MSDSTRRDPLLQADSPQFGLSISSVVISPLLFSLLERQKSSIFAVLHFWSSSLAFTPN